MELSLLLLLENNLKDVFVLLPSVLSVLYTEEHRDTAFSCFFLSLRTQKHEMLIISWWKDNYTTYSHF